MFYIVYYLWSGWWSFWETLMVNTNSCCAHTAPINYHINKLTFAQETNSMIRAKSKLSQILIMPVLTQLLLCWEWCCQHMEGGSEDGSPVLLTFTTLKSSFYFFLRITPQLSMISFMTAQDFSSWLTILLTLKVVSGMHEQAFSLLIITL